MIILIHDRRPRGGFVKPTFVSAKVKYSNKNR